MLKVILWAFAIVLGLALLCAYVKHLFEEGYDEDEIYLHLFRDVPLRYFKRHRPSDDGLYSGSPYKKSTPEYQKVEYDDYPSYYGAGCDPEVAKLMNAPAVDQVHNEQLLRSGGWKCACGNVNAAYVSTCSCGRNKHGDLPQELLPVTVEVLPEDQEVQNAHAIREYKKLLDEGIITAEEFEAKKKQLLGL